MAVEFTPMEEEGRYAIDVDGWPSGFIRFHAGEAKRLIIHSESTNTMPTIELLRAIADKLAENGIDINELEQSE